MQRSEMIVMAAHRVSYPDGVPPVRKCRFDLLRIANWEAKEAEKKQQRILRKKEKEEKVRSEDAKRRIQKKQLKEKKEKNNRFTVNTPPKK